MSLLHLMPCQIMSVTTFVFIFFLRFLLVSTMLNANVREHNVLVQSLILLIAASLLKYLLVPPNFLIMQIIPIVCEWICLVTILDCSKGSLCHILLFHKSSLRTVFHILTKCLIFWIKHSDNMMIFGDDYWCLKVFKKRNVWEKTTHNVDMITKHVEALSHSLCRIDSYFKFRKLYQLFKCYAIKNVSPVTVYLIYILQL